MSAFNELIRQFDKIRDYMRDFYIYGFKTRLDFKHKSPRTYDNEKRRIESYMGEYMKWHYTKSGKNAFISMDCAQLDQNPLYAAWEKHTEYNDDKGCYTCRLTYDKQDETELLIRIFGFGPVVKVLEPEPFREQIRQRVNKQFQLNDLQLKKGQ